MINEEKVILMTHAALYEDRKGKRQLKIAGYFRHDYLSVNLLAGWFWGTVSFAAGLTLWGVCNMEYLMNNLHKMDLKEFGLTIGLLYLLFVLVYLCLLYGVYSFRYHAAKRSVGTYAHTLKKISDIYAQEEKLRRKGADTLTEDMNHDRIT
ncbi:MAG: hypothetical protein Q4C82_06805 [Eubacteriales bacterium]|nr:hypothetical protein [Eubacteriales bacterium]